MTTPLITAAEFAEKRTGREYGGEITKAEAAEAKAAGLLVVFGVSDDIVAFDGIFCDELDAFDGATLLIHRSGVISDDHDCDCPYCGFKKIAKQSATIEALWSSEGDYSWTVKTDIPHATFEIVEDGLPFCRGIVIHERDLPSIYLPKETP